MEGRPGAWRLLQGPGAPVAGLPIGFRFRPTDEELLLHYLRRKALACPLPAGIIHDADLARLHPRDLLPPPGGDAGGERFFFHRAATRCWRRGGGAARAAAAGAGVWRPSGKETLVVSPRCNKRPVGTKRTLVFCARGGARTDWAMHEYRLLPAALHPHGGCVVADPPPPPTNVVGGHGGGGGAVSDWVVCRVFKRARPAHRARSGDGEDDDAEESPSSPLSCVTDAGDREREDDDQEEESSGASTN